MAHARVRAVSLAGAGAAVLVLAWAGVARAHVEPTVAEASAGSRAELGFTVEHGCDGAATTAIAMRLPANVADAVAVDVAGWQSSIGVDPETGSPVVEWVGGPLPDDQPATFTLSFGVPLVPGEVLVFPTVQECGDASIAWISLEDESETPAPRVVVTELDPADTTVPPTTLTTTTETASPTTVSVDVFDGPGNPIPTSTLPPELAAEVDATTDDGSSGGALPIVLVVAVAALLGAGGLWWFRRGDA